MSNAIANSMDSMLKDPEFQSMFSAKGALSKLAFDRTAQEETSSEIEVELSDETTTEVQDESKTASNPRGDCVNCGKARLGWSENMGICKCGPTSGCNPIMGCKDNCDCGCKVKKAEHTMDTLIKSAFDSLMKASSELDEAGFEDLSAGALVLMNDLIVEAKKKNDKKDDKKAKEKAKADKEKAKAKADKEKAKAEKDKNDAKDKAMKAKAKEKLEKEKAKAKSDKK